MYTIQSHDSFLHGSDLFLIVERRNEDACI